MGKRAAPLLALTLILTMTACAAGETPAAPPAATVEASVGAMTPAAASPAPTATPGVGLAILLERDDALLNEYSLLAVAPDAPFADGEGTPVETAAPNTAGADALINWLLGPGAALAAQYGAAEHGEQLFFLRDDRPQGSADIPAATQETRRIRLTTTAAVNESGLLAALLPVFEADYGYEVEVFSASAGKAFLNARSGGADLLLTHAPALEAAFVAEGFARALPGQSGARLTWLYNYYVLVGPADDPAGVSGCATARDAFAAIAAARQPFVSRGDGSGIHAAELALWPESLGITADPASYAAFGDWYRAAGGGMYLCLSMANRQGAYAFSDKATFLTFKASGGL